MVMAPMKAEVPPPPEDHSDEEDYPINLKALRALRAEIQDLQVVLGSIGKGETTPKAYAPYIQRTMNDIKTLMDQIEDSDGRYADDMRHLHNLWEQMQTCPLLSNPSNDFSAQDSTHYLSILDTLCKKLVFRIGYLTIPPRLNRWLQRQLPGYYVPFHRVFEDELPAQADRAAVLDFLRWSPTSVKGGLVDADNGLIYRYIPDGRYLWGSLLLVVVVFAAILWLLPRAGYLTVAGWPLQPKDSSALLVGWLAVFMGVVVHALVGTAKRIQAQGTLPPIMAMSDILPTINARILEIFLKLFLTLMGFFGLVFAAGIENVKPLNAFLVGYSLDSVVELFVTSIEQKAAKQVSSLKQQLGVTTVP